MLTTCFSTGMGSYCPCFSSSTRREPASELLQGRLVEIGAELGERLEFAVLRKFEAETSGDLLHRLDLGIAADAGHGDADVDGGADAGIEHARIRGRSARR